MPNLQIVDQFISELKSLAVKFFLETKNIHYNIERRGEDIALDFDIPGHHIHFEGKITERK